MDISSSFLVDSFFSKCLDIFTADDFYHHLKSAGLKITKDFALNILNSSTMVFPLVDNEYVTRAGVFSKRCFTFMPTKEEVKKGHFIIGHRCMPFVNPDVPPDRIKIKSVNKLLKEEPVVFSMNTAMDIYALYGEGFTIPYIFNDHSNTKYSIASVQYKMPSEIELTAWPLNAITEGKKFTYGDRIMCRVLEWDKDIVEVRYLPQKKEEARSMSISNADIEREEWYSNFEDCLLESMNKNGPCNSIEEQIAYLYLENQEKLCIMNSGSVEEFLMHTKKISFCSYGVETRLWKTGEQVPYNGEWNEDCDTSVIFDDLSVIFAPEIIDAYIENYLYLNQDKENREPVTSLIDEIFPSILQMPPAERKFLMLNIEKRHDIIVKSYNSFADYKLGPVRKRVINLFSKVTELVCSIGCSNLKLLDFPQQDLIILVQLFSHLAKMVEEMENVFGRDQFPVDDVLLSLDGMEETFADIKDTLLLSMDKNTYKNFKIVD